MSGRSPPTPPGLCAARGKKGAFFHLFITPEDPSGAGVLTPKKPHKPIPFGGPLPGPTTTSGRPPDGATEGGRPTARILLAWHGKLPRVCRAGATLGMDIIFAGRETRASSRLRCVGVEIRYAIYSANARVPPAARRQSGSCIYPLLTASAVSAGPDMIAPTDAIIVPVPRYL